MPPMSFFHFFLTGCVGWNIVLIISSEKSGTFSFFFFIFFSSFWPIFRKTTFQPIYPHLMPPHGPRHISCGLVLCPHIPWAQPTYRWLCGSKKFGFLKFFEKLSFWPFLAILPSEDPPSKCPTKEMRALGSPLRVPSPSPDLTLSPKSRQHIIFSLGGHLVHPKCKTLEKSLEKQTMAHLNNFSF